MLFLLALRDTESRQPHSSGASCLLFRILLTGRMETYWVKPSPHFRATQTSSSIYIEKVFYSFNSRSKTHLLKTLNTKEVYKEKGTFSSFFSPEKYIVILSFESISSNLLLKSKTIRIAWWLFPHVFVDVSVHVRAHTQTHIVVYIVLQHICYSFSHSLFSTSFHINICKISNNCKNVCGIINHRNHGEAVLGEVSWAEWEQKAWGDMVFLGKN